MQFHEIDARMREFEQARDSRAIPAVYLVARLDGRGFTRLTKELLDFERPFDGRFRRAMVGAVEHVMKSGFRALYAHTQSDEVSLVFARSDELFGRSVRKWTSLLAGEMSAAFSVGIGRAAAFDCRLIEIPSLPLVVDYFRWRAEDAHRNALNAWCYWTLRKEGVGATDATRQLEGRSVSEKNELLMGRGINYNELPAWQRRGVAVVWEAYRKDGVDLKSGVAVEVERRRLRVLEELPMGEEYGAMVRRVVEEAECG